MDTDCVVLEVGNKTLYTLSLNVSPKRINDVNFFRIHSI